MAENSVPDFATQKKLISKLIESPLRKDDTWCLIDTRWFKQWKKYIHYDSWDNSQSVPGELSQFPGPIDNSPLFTTDGPPWDLKERLVDELDYVLIPREGWDYLVLWHGVKGDQPDIARKVVENGMFVKHCKVEVYLVDFKLSQTDDVDNFITKSFSKAATIENIEKEMKELFNIPDNKETRLWNKYVSNTFEHLGKREITVQDAGLYQGQLIVIEPRNDDGSWPRGEASSAMSSSYSPGKIDNDVISSSTDNTTLDEGIVSSSSNYGPSSSSSYSSSSKDIFSNNYHIGGGMNMGGNFSSSDYYGNNSGGGKKVRGLCGLSNLGNTCFMNSALQCLSNVPLLTQYILNDHWTTELNHDNPLGMGGQIAKSYAELIKQMWMSNCAYTIPRNFKMAVGRFAPQFSGYQQQDSQELMAFLLDGLHEDLNRIKKKPYVEVKDGDGRPDKDVADESWDNYLKRNSSIIVDIFHGLLKSTLVCPDCSKVSVTFDPFCYLSLPLPMKKERQIDVFFIAMDPLKKIVQYKLTVPKMGKVEDLCMALSKFTGVSHDNMVVTDVYNHRFHKVYNQKDTVSHILERDDIFIYEVPVTTEDDPECVIIPVYWREKRTMKGFSSVAVQYSLFGQPLLIPVPRKGCSSRILYNTILERTKRYVHPPSASRGPPSVETNWKNGSTNGTSDSDPEDALATEDDKNYPEEEVDEDSRAEADQYFTNVNHSAADERSSREPSPLASSSLMFSFSIVNSYGSTDLNQLPINDKPLVFSSHTYIAADWSSKTKETCFDSKEAEELEQHDSLRRPNLLKKQVIQLSECLDLFITREILGADDLWYCPCCKKHQQASKKFDVWSLPRVLVIHLKRFSYNKYWRDKIDALVEFPLRGLDMGPYVRDPQCEEANYDLIGVSNHFGGMGGGHYTAYGKNVADQKWYNFDDSSVSMADEESVCSKAAYVLFYERRDVARDGEQNLCSPTAMMNLNIYNSNLNAGRVRQSVRVHSATSSNGEGHLAENSSVTSSPPEAADSTATTPNGTNGSSDDDSMETN